MIEVAERLFVGNAADYDETRDKKDWLIFTCAKEPWHRFLLGYVSRGAPKDSDEYYYAIRGNWVVMNMVDAPKAEFFNKEKMMDPVLNLLEAFHATGAPALVHCNRGESRAPSFALLYLSRTIYRGMPFEQAEEQFKQLVPMYEPGAGIREYVKNDWARQEPVFKGIAFRSVECLG